MKGLNFIFLLVCTSGLAQTITVDDTKPPAELVNILLGNACVELSNIGISSSEAVAYFNNQGGNFPISEGIVLRTGTAEFSEGAYTDTNLSSQLNANSDPYLVQLNANSGQSPLITDVAFMEFDFVPLSSNFTFEFLFGSNEYGQWQCLSSDIFAFVLTDLTTGTTTNLALVPGTNLPVSVRNIKDNAYNPSCGSDHPNLFSTYNVNDPTASTVNMRGYTVVLNASTTSITPGNPYRIRLVIGDSNDATFDSAIFLSAGSFDVNLNLGQDRTICSGDTQTLQTDLDPAIYDHTWIFDGSVLPGETGSTLTVNQSGTYTVEITKNGSGCLITDTVVFNELTVQAPNDILTCYNDNGSYTYDLTANNPAVLGIDPAVYDLFYYASLADISAQNPIPNSNLTAFQSPGNQTIYIKLFNTNSGNFCDAVYSFELLVNPSINVNTSPAPLEVCVSNNPTVDLNGIIPNILNGQSPNSFNFSFFQTQADAQQNANAINNPGAYGVPASSGSYTVWVRVEDAQLPECFTTFDFQILVNPLPPIDTLPEVVECSSFVLPPLTNGSYYTGPNGTGSPLNPGDTIDETDTYYIFSGPDENGCTNQSSFSVFFADEYDLPDTYCGEFSIPQPETGAFYTAPGGPNGTGNFLPTGTILTQSQTIYYYVEIDDILCRDDPFQITILPLPPVDTPSDVVTCFQYTLPVLNNGTYYTQPNGNGTQLNGGEVINSSQTIYVFNDDGTCTNQHVFQVSIIPNFVDINACGSYVLPQLEVGGYFTQPSGQGQQIPEGTTINSTQTIYVYATTTSTPNCTENLSFTVTVIPIPPVDELNDVRLCEDEGGFVLPPLTNGEYFTNPDRQGAQLSPGDTITSTQTVYINNLVNGCDNETDFIVEIRPLPPVENFTDIYTCDPFELPNLENGTFYTQAGGNGTELPPGTVIDSTQQIYIYNSYEDFTGCNAESFFTVYYNGVEVRDFEDVSVCDEYILPALDTGNYFSETGGQGTPFFAGDTLIASQEIFVYAEKGDRFICTDETSFFVEISETPILPPFPDVESCGSYTLPELDQSQYNVGYYREPNGQNEILPEAYTFSEPGVYTIYVYAVSPTNPDCLDQAQFELRVYPLLELNIEGGTICKNPETGEVISPVILTSGLDPASFTVNWYLNEELVFSGPNFTATEPGIYTVKTEKLEPENGADCNYAPTMVQVVESAQPIIDVDITEPFSDVAVITVEIINGVGQYEFQLDDGPFQSENEFYDVESGAHIVRVRGINGNCGDAVVEVEVIKFPKFFTPNNDGINDRWNISDLQEHPEAIIRVFDRYGKLLATFPPLSEGWGGLYNGRKMPSNDYWFVVEFMQDGVKKTFKSHFTLKR